MIPTRREAGLNDRCLTRTRPRGSASSRRRSVCDCPSWVFQCR